MLWNQLEQSARVFSFVLALHHALYLQQKLCHSLASEDANDEGELAPRVLFAFFVRNKAHTLPYFLGTLEDLDYPKDRIYLWIRSDHNADHSIDLLNFWTEQVKNFYFHINYTSSSAVSRFNDEGSPFDWPKERLVHVSRLKEEALEAALELGVDYLFFLDCDNFLVHPRTLQILMAQDSVVISPMLQSFSFYSNFYGNMTEEGQFFFTEEFEQIVKRQKQGLFAVPAVYGSVLIDLRKTVSDFLTFDVQKLPNYKGDLVDYLIFAHSARLAGIELHLLNTHYFGAILEPANASFESLSDDVQSIIYLQLEFLFNGPPGLLVSPFLLSRLEQDRQLSAAYKAKLGFDELFLINLRRRPDRLRRMRACFDVLQLNVRLIEAVDGAALTEPYLEELGVTFMPEYRDPYHNRPMTMGEVGCFLSHFRIWQEMVDRGLSRALIFEDDLRFVRNMRGRLERVMREADESVPDWELIYIGRKRLLSEAEEMVTNCTVLARVGYSYWTLGYALSLNGARKLLSAQPLKALVPVDEYLPIMFNRHPNSTWQTHFASAAKLNAFTADPLLVYPTHYTGETGYVSDTESSRLLGLDTTQPKSSSFSSAEETSISGASVSKLTSDLGPDSDKVEPSISDSSFLAAAKNNFRENMPMKDEL